MHRLLISYDLLEPTRSEMTLGALYTELDSLGAVQIQDSVWTVDSEMNVPTFIAELQGYFGPTDRLLVVRFNDHFNRNGINDI